MERSTSVVTGMGEQSLTPGEQRIIALMEQGQQRLDKRLDGMDKRLDGMDKRLQSLEEGQQRTDLRLRSLEEGQQRTNSQLEDTNNRLEDLTIQVDKEAATNKMRDGEFRAELDRIIKMDQERTRALYEATLADFHREMNSFRKTFTERLDQHTMRLKVLEQTLEQNYAHTHRNSAAIAGLQVDVRKLVELVEGLVQAQQPPRMASAP